MGFNNLIELAFLHDDHITAVNVRVEDASSEGKVMCGLSDHDGVIRLGKRQWVILWVFG